MILRVFGEPQIANGDQQEIKVLYTGQRTDITKIMINADLVTIGVAAQMLMKIYNEHSSRLLPEHALEVKNTIEKVINSERH